MIGNWEINGLSPAERFWVFADSYLRSSHKLCNQLVRRKRGHLFPEACVVTFLARHAVELFLKGMLVARTGKAPLTHNINELVNEYTTNFTELKFVWEIPFQTQYIGMSASEIKKAKRAKRWQYTNEIYRYPVNREIEDWQAAIGFEPHGFIKELIKIENDFVRLKAAFRELKQSSS